MIWQVQATKRTLKALERMPRKAEASFWRLHAVLKAQGPTGPKDWKNYGKLKGRDQKYHCHLTGDHQWVACWQTDGDQVIIEIVYVGSHQGAPY